MLVYKQTCHAANIINSEEKYLFNIYLIKLFYCGVRNIPSDEKNSCGTGHVDISTINRYRYGRLINKNRRETKINLDDLAKLVKTRDYYYRTNFHIVK